MSDNHGWTSHAMLVGAFTAGGVVGCVAGWVARGSTADAQAERATSYDDHDRTTYPPDAEDDVPPAVAE